MSEIIGLNTSCVFLNGSVLKKNFIATFLVKFLKEENRTRIFFFLFLSIPIPTAEPEAGKSFCSLTKTSFLRDC